MDLQVEYTRHSPFLAAIKERRDLAKSGSLKTTQHIVLDLKGSQIHYSPGDSVGILPSNDPALIERTLKALGASGNEVILDRQGETHLLREFLLRRANLKGVSRKMVGELKSRISGGMQRELERLLEEANKHELKGWLHAREVWDLLEEFPEGQFTPQEVVDMMMPLLPRFYSIASAQSFVGEELHLTVSYLRYETHGMSRIGVCTHYLCHLVPLQKPVVPIYLHPTSDFKLPEAPGVPIIMVGPGTGIAPFRAFLQEREMRRDPGKNWLFFGEWTRGKEFFYEEEWERWISKGMLKLCLAFSRDQPYKVYVQNKMAEEGALLYQWLEEGAILYVCGDAHRMAKDVDHALHRIVEEHGRMDEEGAIRYVKRLRAEKRYLRDVY